MRAFLGVDIGSVSTNLVLMAERGELWESVYLRTRGQPLQSLRAGLEAIERAMIPGTRIAGVAATGSGRQLAGALLGADLVKNEITSHAVAALHFLPEVQTIVEIGGQDSKIIIVRQGTVVDFAMNTVCAAGTGSFLDQQASRLGIPIEEFGSQALRSRSPCHIAGRCTVFAETDMVHKQQMGHALPDIIAGLCRALVRNYLANVAKGKELLPPVVFQGGVAANLGIRRALEEALGHEVIVPPHYHVMGAIGAALLARDRASRNGFTRFRGFEVIHQDSYTTGFQCPDCPNACEIVEVFLGGRVVARWGDRCGKRQFQEVAQLSQEQEGSGSCLGSASRN
jgi:predicted CoA-substrate-specific enzyme activase